MLSIYYLDLSVSQQQSQATTHNTWNPKDDIYEWIWDFISSLTSSFHSNFRWMLSTCAKIVWLQKAYGAHLEHLVIQVCQENLPCFEAAFLRSNYISTTQHTYIKIWTIIEAVTNFYRMVAFIHLLITKYIFKQGAVCTSHNFCMCTSHQTNIWVTWRH
jgi:hypothetical protein